MLPGSNTDSRQAGRQAAQRTGLVQVRVEGHLLHVAALAHLHKRLARGVGAVEHLGREGGRGGWVGGWEATRLGKACSLKAVQAW